MDKDIIVKRNAYLVGGWAMIKLSTIMFGIASCGESGHTSAPDIFYFLSQETKSHSKSHVPLG